MASKEESIDPLAEIRLALLAWIADVTDSIKDALSNAPIGIVGQEWQQDPDGTYQLRPVLQHIVPGQTFWNLRQLPTYPALETAMTASQQLQPYLNHVFGTPVATTTITPWTLAFAFIPHINEIASGAGYSFDARYDEISRALIATEVEYLITCPIQGVSFAADQIDLAPDLTIARLTPDETISGLATGTLPITFPSINFHQTRDGSEYGLKKVVRLPIVLRDAQATEDTQPTEAIHALRSLNATEETEQLQQCFALLTHQSILITGTMTRQRTPLFLLAEGVSYSLSPIRGHLGPAVMLDTDDCQTLKRIWTIANDESFPLNKALGLALRRLAYATQRIRPEDRLLDIFIAAEALYLTDSGDVKDRGELKYRLSLRAAAWSEGTLPGWSKREVLSQMRRGYDLRSIVAHGGEPRPRDVTVRGSQVNITEFVQATEK